MDENYKLARHTELWQAGTKLTRRTALGGLLFAVVVLFNVLTPYAETAEARATLADLQQRQARVLEARAGLVERLQALASVRATVEEAGWESHREALVVRLEAGSVQDPQAEADAALQAMAAEFQETVVGPLEDLEGPGGGGPGGEGALARILTARIDAVIEDSRGTDWYRAGSGASTRLEDELQSLRTDAIEALVRLRNGVSAQMELTTEQSETLSAQLADADAAAQSRLDGAIPSWARGLVSVELMVRIYVLVILGLALFLVGSGVSAAGHFQAMADGHGVSAESRGDPVLSSPWTLTWRGAGGTAATVLTYLGVLGGLWLCLTLGMAAVGDDGLLARPTWLPHSIMLLAVATVVAAPLLSRSRGGGGTPAGAESAAAES